MSRDSLWLANIYSKKVLEWASKTSPQFERALEETCQTTKETTSKSVKQLPREGRQVQEANQGMRLDIERVANLKKKMEKYLRDEKLTINDPSNQAEVTQHLTSVLDLLQQTVKLAESLALKQVKLVEEQKEAVLRNSKSFLLSK